jgi:TolB-like protein
MEESSMIGSTISHYRIVEKLGRGGMGEVFLAEDTNLNRRVAVKALPDTFLRDPERLARFDREARLLASLNHPNIAAIYGLERTNSGPLLIMELVEGETLAGLIASGPIPAERALRLAAQVADALAAAHARRIVHRDLKPSNILVAPGDRVKVVDFGLAKLAGPPAPTDETAEAVSTSGAILGTVPYMSPEQASGRVVDARSDLFSLGAILYEMLAGRRPFCGDSRASTLAAILRDAPTPIAGVAPAVAQLVEHSLRKDVGERFQSAAEMKGAIGTCLVFRPVPAKPSIAVLPFTNMTGTKQDDYLCEGLAEEIINALTRIPGLRVIARTSAFAVGRMGLDIREAGARLDVGNILEGSVRREGRRVRVTVQLATAIDGSHIWSERYDRELTDVLVLEDEIAAAIAARLRLELGRDNRERLQPAVDAEAHAAYLEGRYYFAKGTPEAMAQAKACFERAIARDPNSALAYDSLAELHWYLGFFGNMPPREAFSLSTWYALHALELDETLAQTHALLGMLRKELDYNWPEVDRELCRALELSRESPLVRLRYAISALLPRARIDEGMAEVEVVLQTDPLSLLVRWWLSVMAYLARRPERTIEEGRHMIALDSTHFLGHWTLGIGLNETGARRDAVSALEKAHELSGRIPFTLGFLAYVYGCAGRCDDTRMLLKHAEECAAAAYVPPSTFALGHIGLGDWDTAFTWLDRAIDTRDPIIMPIKSFPFLDPVRSDARYRALLRKMHLD